MEEKKITIGKKIGTSAYVISEIIVILVSIAVAINIFFEKRIDSGLISALLMFQSSIFITVWGAKASSNFAKKEKNNE